MLKKNLILKINSHLKREALPFPTRPGQKVPFGHQKARLVPCLVSLFVFIISLLASPISVTSVQADIVYTTKDGEEIVLQPPPKDKKDWAEDRRLFVAAYYNGYKDVPLEKLDSSFKNTDDLKAWLGATFDNEIQLINENKSYMVRATLGSQVVGMVFFEKIPNSPHSLYVRQMSVLPEFQNKGIGTKLIFSIRDDKTLFGDTNLFPDITHLFLIVRLVNRSGIAFYENLGFIKDPYMHEGYDPKKYTGYNWNAKHRKK